MATLCKYERWYWNIIEAAEARGWSRTSAPCYVEAHHPYPRQLFGKIENFWTVLVTAKEHYILHLLLSKFTGMRMPMFWSEYTSKSFSPARKIASRQNAGEAHPRYGKKHTPETIALMTNNPNKRTLLGTVSITNGTSQRFIYPGEPIPDGWTLGGVKESEETRQKKRDVDPAKRAVNKGRKFSQEWLDNMKKGQQNKPELVCPECGKKCQGGAALGSHMRKHRSF